MKFNLTFVIIIIIILIYIGCYFIFPPSIQILQTTITDFTFATLYTRQPIIIYDNLEEKELLISTWFKYNFIKELNDNQDNQEWYYNKYKYLFINANKDTEIIIYKASVNSKPPTEEDRIIAIKLTKGQSLILPFKWKYYIEDNNDIKTWGIHDLITFFVAFVF